MTNPTPQLIDLTNKINDAKGYIPITPEYNHNTSAVMKNTLDYFLEEYYFKPSAIVSYSPAFGGSTTDSCKLLIDNMSCQEE